MNKRYLMLGLLSAALAQGAASIAQADALELVIPTKAGAAPPVPILRMLAGHLAKLRRGNRMGRAKP